MTGESTFGRRGRNETQEHPVFRPEIAQPIEGVVRRGGVRWGRWVLGAFGVCFVVGVIGTLTEGKPPLAVPDASQVAPLQPAAQKKCGATLAEFTSLAIGTSPARAETIIGCKGEETSRVSVGGHESVMLTWPGEGFLSNMNATFSDGRLVAKAQLGLK